MEPGLGKTVTALTTINDLLFDRMELAPGQVLVVAPKSVVDSVWVQEAQLWPHLRHLRLVRVTGSAQQRIEALRQKADVYVISRENFAWLLKFFGRRWPFRMLVWDEAGDLKRVRTVRFAAARTAAWLPQMARVLELTGTPSPNSMEELWPQLYLLDQGARLGRTLTAYRDAHFKPVRFNRSKPAEVWEYGVLPGHDTIILSKLQDIAMSMRQADWLQLPPLISRIITVTMEPKAKARYDELAKHAIIEYDKGAVSAVNAAVLVGKLAQAANGAIYDDDKRVVVLHDEKLDALELLVDELAGQNMLVFYGYIHDKVRLKRRFPQADVFDETFDVVEKWNRGEIPMLLAHPKSAGHGLNLQQGGHHVVWFALPWSLELYLQARARLHRSGQQHPVVVHHLTTAGTVDEQIIDRLGDKQVTLDTVLNSVRMHAQLPLLLEAA